jgi:hypothetical protein
MIGYAVLLIASQIRDYELPIIRVTATFRVELLVSESM